MQTLTLSTVTLVRWTRTLADGRRCYPLGPATATCSVLALRPQYLSVRAPDGEEVWVRRSDGVVEPPRGGRPGIQGAPRGQRSTAWAAWSLSQADLSVVWVESAQVEAAEAREERARSARLR